MSVKITKFGDPLKGADESIKNGNLKTVIRVAAQAKALAPVDSGTLRGSITWKVPGKEGGHDEGPMLKVTPGKDDGLVGTATEYAGYVEFGTRRQAAQPYLVPAAIIEVLGPNGMNVLKKETIESMKKSLMSGRKINEF